MLQFIEIASAFRKLWTLCFTLIVALSVSNISMAKEVYKANLSGLFGNTYSGTFPDGTILQVTFTSKIIRGNALVGQACGTNKNGSRWPKNGTTGAEAIGGTAGSFGRSNQIKAAGDKNPNCFGLYISRPEKGWLFCEVTGGNLVVLPTQDIFKKNK